MPHAAFSPLCRIPDYAEWVNYSLIVGLNKRLAIHLSVPGMRHIPDAIPLLKQVTRVMANETVNDCCLMRRLQEVPRDWSSCESDCPK
jgi:hypothetical protein